ncbi:hypothetical protein AAE478_002272 [Parahypoxylon ruwenzoriense]
MLEYFTYKKVKKHREEKAEKQRLEEGKKNGKGKEKENVEENAAAAAAKASTEASSSMSPKASGPEIASAEPPPRTSVDEKGVPILDHEDEKFLERLTSPSDISAYNDGGDETPPPLPPRVKTPVIELDSDDTSSFASQQDGGSSKPPSDRNTGKDKGKDENGGDAADKKTHKPKHFSFVTNLSRNISLRHKPKPSKKEDLQQQQQQDHLSIPAPTEAKDAEHETRREETDMARVLDDLDLGVSPDSHRAFSLSHESAETLRRFTQVLKDLVNGVPTAYGDLVGLMEDRDGALARSYERLPRSLKKLVAQLPEKLTSSLAPELLAVAAEAQGLPAEEGKKDGAMKKLLSPGNLMELVTKPGAVVGLLKGIVNALKVRWPAFVGTNVLWSVAVFLLLSALWYCYKRGRETRLEKEALEKGEAEVVAVDGEGKESSAAAEVVASSPQQQQQHPSVSVSVSAPAVSSLEGK